MAFGGATLGPQGAQEAMPSGSHFGAILVKNDVILDKKNKLKQQNLIISVKMKVGTLNLVEYLFRPMISFYLKYIGFILLFMLLGQ